ncbi:MAG: peptide-binding protein [Helicobacteraceae bacterium]|jgi:peptide/nickel transport system substrate-binding protein|nr:peptide-binding protein [Helicobacteraceae bacterium]
MHLIYIFLALLTTLFSQSALQLSLSGFPARLNPLLATDSVSGELSGWLFDGLLKYDKNANIIGDIAESWRFIDEKTIVFNLRRDRFWHDGKPVTARDAVFTYETAVSDRLATPYASNYRMIESVEASDDFTFIVRYKAPYFKTLEMWLSPLIPKHALENDPDLMTSSFNSRPIGNSYYRLDELVISRNVELNAFAGYKPRPPLIDKIIFEYVQEPSVEFLKLKSRSLHIGALDAMQLYRQIDEDFKKDYQIVETSSFAYSYLGFNLRNPKFQNPKTREALSYALDRQKLIDILFFGRAKICDGTILEGALGYNPEVKSPKQDIAKARKLLAEAGYDETNPLTIEISTNTGNATRMYAAQIIQSQLAEAGVIVKLRVMEWQAFLSRVVHARNFEMILMGWTVPLMPDPFTIWHSSSDKAGGFNFVGYRNEEVDRLIELAERTSDRNEVARLFREFSAVIARDNPYLFLYVPNSIAAISRKIEPIEPTIIGFEHNRYDWRILP